MNGKTTPMEDMLLPWFQEDEARKVAQARRDRVHDQLEHWHYMWPEWDGVFKVGMRVCCGLWGTLVEDGKTVGGFEAKAGESFYSQMAPAYILEILDPETFVVVIDYPKGTDNEECRVLVEHHNGIKLRFDICDLDPAQDVWINNPNRKGGDNENTRETAGLYAAVG
jgi:hypothetical protein